jgi:hypothetical protein
MYFRMDQPLSPLPPPLDPSKLREMVVDKQQSAATPHQVLNKFASQNSSFLANQLDTSRCK